MASGMTGAQVLNYFVDKRRGRNAAGDVLAESANMGDITVLKARLTALKPTSYTAARLTTMTVNDMLMALRLESADVAGIK